MVMYRKILQYRKALTWSVANKINTLWESIIGTHLKLEYSELRWTLYIHMALKYGKLQNQ